MTIIRIGTNNQDRTKMLKIILSCIIYLKEVNNKSVDYYDIVAFIALCIQAIVTSIEKTASAWENRGYWIKADKLRLEWNWIDVAGIELIESISKKNAERVGEITAILSDRIKVKGERMPVISKTQWLGALDRLKLKS